MCILQQEHRHRHILGGRYPSDPWAALSYDLDFNLLRDPLCNTQESFRSPTLGLCYHSRLSFIRIITDAGVQRYIAQERHIELGAS